MTSITWTSAINGDWSNAANWSSDAAPDGSDDVLIDVAGACTVSITGAAAVNALTLLAAGATLLDSGSLTVATTLDVAAGLFVLQDGGVVSGGTLIDATGAASIGGGTLDNMVYDGTLNVTGQYVDLALTTGLTLAGADGTGAGTLNITGYDSSVILAGSGTLDGGTINIGCATNYAFLDSSQVGDAADTLTLGAGLVLNALRGLSYVSDSGTAGWTGSQVQNLGTIDATTSGGRLTIAGNAFVNAGSVDVANGGSLYLAVNDVANSGAITVAGGGALTIIAAGFDNTGTISEAGGVLTLDADCTTAQLGVITSTDGRVVLAGTLDNTGATLDLAGGFALAGTIVGGTVFDAGTIAQGGGTLDHAAFDGTIAVASRFTILGGETMAGADGSGTGTITLTGSDSTLTLAGGGTLDGATVDIGSGGYHAVLTSSALGGTAETLTLGANLLLNEVAGAGVVSDSGSTAGSGAALVNLGTIAAATGGATLTIAGNRFTNSGTIIAGNGGDIIVTAASFTNAAGTTLSGGAYEVDAGGTLSLASPGASAITTDSAVLTLNGAGSTLSAGAASLDATLTLVSRIGTLNLLGGRGLTAGSALVVAGQLNLAGGTLSEAALTVALGGTLSGFGTLTAAGAIDNAGSIVASGGMLTLAQSVGGTGSLVVAPGATLEVGSVAASATVSFNGPDGTLLLADPAACLASIANFADGDTIDLAGVVVTAATIQNGGLVLSTSAGPITLPVSGTTPDSLTLASDQAGGTLLIAAGTQGWRLAMPGAHAPAVVTFANRHVGSPAAAALTVSNIAPADGHSQALDATLSEASAGVTISGAITGLAAGACDSTSLLVGLQAGAAGDFAGTALLSFASDAGGDVTRALTPQTVDVTGAVYAYAAPLLSGTVVDFGAARVGAGTLDASVTLHDGTAATAYQESLIYATGAIMSATGSDFGGGGSGTLLAGGATTLSFSLNAGAAGTFSGSAALALTSTGAGTSGLADTALAPQTLTLDGSIYATAAPLLSAGTIDFGVVHVGQKVVAQTDTLTNAATGLLTDTLTGSYLSSAGFTGSGSLGAGILGGSSLGLSFGIVTTQAGILSGTATLTLASHDASLADVAVGVAPIELTGTVDAYAAPQFQVVSGGTLSGSGNSLTLTLNSVAQGAADTAVIDVANAAIGPADLLSGGFGVVWGAGFTNTGFGTSALNAIAAGSASGPFSIRLNTATLGTFSETVVLHATSVNASTTTRLGAETLTVTGSVGPQPPLTLTLNAATSGSGAASLRYIGGAADDTFIAGPGTLLAQDVINGAAGVNTLDLTGGGTFDLRVPATLVNIQVVNAQEGDAQTIDLRAFTTVTLNVAPAATGAGGITIVGNKDSSVINLGAGQDTVTLGSASETVNGGSGSDIYNITAATAGAAIHSGSGSNTIMVSGGNRVVLNAGDNDATVELSQSANLTLSKMAFMHAIGSSGNDVISAGAAGQTLTGGLGADKLYGLATHGILFQDTAAGLNGDSLFHFGVGDRIDITDLLPGASGFAFKATGSSPTTLAVTDGTHSADILLMGAYKDAHFVTASDGHGGLSITYTGP